MPTRLFQGLVPSCAMRVRAPSARRPQVAANFGPRPVASAHRPPPRTVCVRPIGRLDCAGLARAVRATTLTPPVARSAPLFQPQVSRTRGATADWRRWAGGQAYVPGRSVADVAEKGGKSGLLPPRSRILRVARSRAKACVDMDVFRLVRFRRYWCVYVRMDV